MCGIISWHFPEKVLAAKVLVYFPHCQLCLQVGTLWERQLLITYLIHFSFWKLAITSLLVKQTICGGGAAIKNSLEILSAFQLCLSALINISVAKESQSELALLAKIVHAKQGIGLWFVSGLQNQNKTE